MKLLNAVLLSVLVFANLAYARNTSSHHGFQLEENSTHVALQFKSLKDQDDYVMGYQINQRKILCDNVGITVSACKFTPAEVARAKRYLEISKQSERLAKLATEVNEYKNQEFSLALMRDDDSKYLDKFNQKSAAYDSESKLKRLLDSRNHAQDQASIAHFHDSINNDKNGIRENAKLEKAARDQYNAELNQSVFILVAEKSKETSTAK